MAVLIAASTTGDGNARLIARLGTLQTVAANHNMHARDSDAWRLHQLQQSSDVLFRCY
jgi:hypothetical protein